MQRKVYLEAVRGLAAFMVVLTHFMAAFYPAAGLAPRFRAHASWEAWFPSTPLGIFLAGRFDVCLFFILSGFVLSLPFFGEGARGQDHLSAALIKRPFRLAGLVVFSELLAMGLWHAGAFFNGQASGKTYSVPWLRHHWRGEPVPFAEFFWDIFPNPFTLGVKYNPPLWTISYEFYGSVGTFIFLMLFRRSSWRWLAYVVTFLCAWGTYYQGFLIGVLCADLVRNYPDLVTRYARGVWVWPLLTLGLLLASEPAYLHAEERARTIYRFLPPLSFLGGSYSMLGGVLVFVALLLSPVLQRFLSRGWFAFLGRISYALYALHMIVIGTLSCWLFLQLREHQPYHRAVLWTALISLPVLLGLAYVVARWIDEPITHLANRLARGWQSSNRDPQPAPGVT